MNTLIKLSTVASMAVLAGGCASFVEQLQTPAATIAPTQSRTLPPFAQTAVVWSIDGERVSLNKDAHRIAPGEHSLSVVPRQHGSLQRTRAWAASAASRGINIAEMTVHIEDGQRVMLAAVVRRHRVYTEENGEDVPLGPWQTTVVPYIVAGNR